LNLDSRPTLFAESHVAPPLTGNLFFALYPDAAAAARIAALARGLREEHGLTGKPLKTENFHVSLHPLAGFIGSPHATVHAALEAALAVSFCSFDVVFDCAGSFARKGDDRHPFVLQGSEGVAAVRAFHRALQIEMRRAGFRARARTLTPHVTMLYDHRRVEWRAVDPVRWRANEFILVESLIGHATHVPLGRWRLGSRGRLHHVGLDRGFISAAGMFREFDAP
jgi:RNA 2',3'-cyclic 3'-phosphodiesterase